MINQPITEEHKALAVLETKLSSLKPALRRLAFHIDKMDAALGGGLGLGMIHEIGGAKDDVAALGFALGLAAMVASQSQKPILWVRRSIPGQPRPYPPALSRWGLNRHPLILVETSRDIDFAWAVEEGLRVPSLSLVLAEGGMRAPVTGRRWQLAAQQSGTTGLWFHEAGRGLGAWSAATRWVVRPRPSQLPQPCCSVTLDRCRLPGGWTSWQADRAWEITWDETALRFHLSAVL